MSDTAVVEFNKEPFVFSAMSCVEVSWSRRKPHCINFLSSDSDKSIVVFRIVMASSGYHSYVTRLNLLDLSSCFACHF